MKRFRWFFLAAAVLFAGQAFAATTIRLGHFQAGDLKSPKHAASLAFKNFVETATSGSIKVEIFPASQLGNEATVMEGLELGNIQMAIVHDGGISAHYKVFNILSIPYLFTDHNTAWKMADSPFLDDLSADMEKSVGIKLFALADNGLRSFTNSKRVIRTPEDMKGLKFRVMPTPIYINMVNALGASPMAVPWPELPTALQQGMVDGQENGVTNIVDASLYQTQKYFTANGHVFSWHGYLMNADFFNARTDVEKKAIRDGIQLAKVIHRGMTAAMDANATTILSNLGMECYNPTPDEMAKFRELAQPSGRAWVIEQVGEEWVKKLEAAIAAASK